MSRCSTEVSRPTFQPIGLYVGPVPRPDQIRSRKRILYMPCASYKEPRVSVRVVAPLLARVKTFSYPSLKFQEISSWCVSLISFFLLFDDTYLISFLQLTWWVWLLAGSKEGQGSTTFLQARQIWRWQAEEEGSFLVKVSFFLSLIAVWSIGSSWVGDFNFVCD